MKRYKIVYSNFPLAVAPQVTQRERLMRAIHGMLDEAQSPQAKADHEAWKIEHAARRQREEDELSAGESTI